MIHAILHRQIMSTAPFSCETIISNSTSSSSIIPLMVKPPILHDHVSIRSKTVSNSTTLCFGFRGKNLNKKTHPRMHPSLLPPKCHSNIQLKSQKTNVSTLVPQQLGHPSQEPLLEDHHNKEYHVIIL
jgi:hypothetical protein